MLSTTCAGKGGALSIPWTMMLLQQTTAQRHMAGLLTLDRPLERHGGEAVVQVRDLVRRFGTFIAVDHVSFDVRRGEIFGLLGPNGAGKTATKVRRVWALMRKDAYQI